MTATSSPLAHHTFSPWTVDGDRRIVAAKREWQEPLTWNREAEASGERRRVMVNVDVFEGQDSMDSESWSQIDEYARYRLWALIWSTPSIDWVLLTSNPGNIIGPNRYIWSPGATANSVGWVKELVGHEEASRFYPSAWPPDNLWLGARVSNQQEADERIPQLLRVPAAVRFVMCEPRSSINLRRIYAGEDAPKYDCLRGMLEFTGQRGDRISWAIVSGESGPDARPTHPAWVRWLRDQCQAASVPFYFSGWGDWYVRTSVPAERTLVGVRWEEGMPDGVANEIVMYRVGADRSDRLLDGRTWDEIPNQQQEPQS
jgi:protein gp37